MNRPELLTLTAADLEGATNKLTLKRAQMDLDEGMTPESITDHDDLIVVWPDRTCTFGDQGFLYSQCTCPSRKICRHLVRTILYLRRELQSAPGEESTPQGSGRYDLNDLRSWAGAALWRKSCDLMIRGLEAQIESEDLVTFPTLGVRVRFLPGLGIEGALCSCGAINLCEHRLVAALSFHDEIPDVHARDQEAVEKTCTELWPRVVEFLRVGLETLPAELSGDLILLAQEVETRLPAAALDLRSLAALLKANHRRSAGFSPAAWLQTICRLAARLIALESDLRPKRRLQLIGRSRRDYIEAASLQLWMLGAEGFRGPGGTFLRLWLLQPETGGFLHAGVGRGANSPVGPQKLFHSPGLWGDLVPARLFGELVHLVHPQLSPDGAISGSKKTSAQLITHRSITLENLDTGIIARSTQDLFARWSMQLPPLLRSSRGTTLPAIIKTDPGRPFAGPPVFDEFTQTLLVPLNLVDGGVLTLEARHRHGNDALLNALSQIQRWASAPTHWFLRFWQTSRGLRAEPIALWFKDDDKPYSLMFSQIPLSPKAPVKPPSIRQSAGPASPLETALDQVLSVLESSVCQGMGRHSPYHESRLRDAAALLSRLDLGHGAGPLKALITEQDPDKAARLLTSIVAWTLSLQEIAMGPTRRTETGKLQLQRRED